jgi:transposase
MVINNERVPMPEKKITYKKGVNGTVYVYYTVRAYRNKQGKPTSDEVAIGKKDVASGMLIPNLRYYEIFSSTDKANGGILRRPAVPNKAAACGNVYAMYEVARQTGLLSILEKCFPEKWSQLLAAAFYMLCEGNVMMYLEDWFDETELPFSAVMNDMQCSRIFASISHKERQSFFEEWIKRRSDDEYIAYDVTSISTYSQGIDIAEWGYNRDGERIPQINLGMYYGISSHLPVYYTTYSGSINDKSHLPFMLANTQQLGIKQVKFVLDRGFVTEDNLRYMHNKGYLYVTSVQSNRTEALKLIDTYKDSVRKAANRISEYELYGIPLDFTLSGLSMKAHLYFDPAKQRLDELELYAHLERLEAELEKMGRTKRISKKYTDFFNIVQEKAEGFAFTQNNEKIDEKLNRAGLFILLTNDPSMSSSEVLKLYRVRDTIEKNFEQLKNQLDFKRLHTHLNRTTDGKVFVGFLALIIRSYFMKRIKENKETKHLTLEKVLRELRKIKTFTLSDMSKLISPLTKLQKTIFTSLGVTQERLQNCYS